MKISLRPCLLSELDLLQRISQETFMETYGFMNRPEAMDTHLENAFNREKLWSELSHGSVHFYFVFAGDDLAGYLKVNEVPVQSDINDPDSMEVERIYVRKAYKGIGIGRKIIDHAFQLAKKREKTYIWLGVWEKNKDAISFYTRLGFYKAGEHTFKLGDEWQRDFIMKKPIDQGQFQGQGQGKGQ